MKETFKINKEIELGSSIGEVTSISLEVDYNEEERCVAGNFILEGTYKTSLLSFNNKSFKKEIPFKKEIENYKRSSTNVEIEDFTYDINDNKIIVDIEYSVSYDNEELEISDEKLEEMIENEQIEIINLRENNNDDIEEETTIEEPIISEENEEPVEENRNIEISNTILENINNEERYITYHVYVCENDDTFESISNKFNVSVEEIKDYNNITEIKYGLKLILPVNNEEN